MVIPRSVRQEENEVHMGGMENAYRILFGNPEIKMLFGRPRYRLEDEAKTDLKGLWCELWSLLNWFRGLSSELLERAHSVLYATDRTLQVGICYSSNQIKSSNGHARYLWASSFSWGVLAISRWHLAVGFTDLLPECVWEFVGRHTRTDRQTSDSSEPSHVLHNTYGLATHLDGCTGFGSRQAHPGEWGVDTGASAMVCSVCPSEGPLAWRGGPPPHTPPLLC